MVIRVLSVNVMKAVITKIEIPDAIVGMVFDFM